mgnify:CR=1 FL=1
MPWITPEEENKLTRESTRLREGGGNRLSDEELERGLTNAKLATPAPWTLRNAGGGIRDVGLHRPGHANVLGEFYSEFVAQGLHQPQKALANAVMTAWFRQHGIVMIEDLLRARAALEAIIANAPDEEPNLEEYDDTESASTKGVEVGAWEAAVIAKKALWRKP